MIEMTKRQQCETYVCLHTYLPYPKQPPTKGRERAIIDWTCDCGTEMVTVFSEGHGGKWFADFTRPKKNDTDKTRIASVPETEKDAGKILNRKWIPR